MKRKTLLLLTGSAFVIIGIWFYLSSRPLDIRRDCVEFAKSWSTGGSMPNVKLLCGMKPMNSDSADAAWVMLHEISGEFNIGRIEESPRFKDTQGVFVHVNIGGRDWAFGLQGHESSDQTAIEFERALGHACVLREMRTEHKKKFSTYEAMRAQLPKYLDSLKKLNVTAITISGYGYPDWDQAIAGVSALAAKNEEARGKSGK